MLVGIVRITLPKSAGDLGLRRARDHNVALVGKHVWDILIESEKPWVHLLRANYFSDGSFMDAEIKQGSPVFKAFGKAREVLRQGFEFKIGNDLSSFWDTTWCGSQPLGQLVDFVHYYDIDHRIRDLWDGNRWKLEQLWTLLPSHLVQTINAHHLRLNPHVADSIRWTGHITGNYTAKAGYN